jgi:tRNA U34 5-methylaminomethyl-2-thiouridine-forming methyltransferase MnmC
MDRKIILTSDGSHSISVPAMGVTYHSIHGAIQESRHVFIEAGLKHLVLRKHSASSRIRILEMGLGTGLNALLTLVESGQLHLAIDYTALELFPLASQEAQDLNYCTLLEQERFKPLFENIHTSDWERPVPITDYFSLEKKKISVLDFPGDQNFDLVYFDAFAPNAQPELWTTSVFEKLFSMVNPGGLLVTYCSKGEVRRAMKAAGFEVEKLPGPPRKREMLRARKGNEA